MNNNVKIPDYVKQWIEQNNKYIVTNVDEYNSGRDDGFYAGAIAMYIKLVEDNKEFVKFNT